MVKLKYKGMTVSSFKSKAIAQKFLKDRFRGRKKPKGYRIVK